MQIKTNDPPREYKCGNGPPVTIKDCARIELSADEQVTFATPNGGEYDVTRKSWGFYATPSINGRLERFGLRSVLVRNRTEQYFVLLVEQSCEPAFHQYVEEEGLAIVGWLDDQTLKQIDTAISKNETFETEQA